jgi:hypothetical protein
MYNTYRNNMFHVYNNVREQLIQNPKAIISTEEYITTAVCKMFLENYAEFESDYNEASYLHPFWANYPPDDRGRSPVGDQIPWIEVGEHAVGHKASRILSQQCEVREIGLPSGADNRFLIIDPTITKMTDGITNKALVFLVNISRKWSTRPRETVHSTAKNGPALRGAGPPIENA